MSKAHKKQCKIVLAYSGGLDTSVILCWLQEKYQCEVIACVVDVGQDEDLDAVRQKAMRYGASECHILDVREEFARDYVFPMFRANAVYEGTYLLGTAIARPLIAKKQIDIARLVGADAVAHGATGKGNDQVRFELSYYSLAPELRVIAPWREWSFNGRSALLDYAQSKGIDVAMHKATQPPYSMDANLLHISYEGNMLEDPWVEAEESMYRWTVSPESAPDNPEYIVIGFECGDAVSLNGIIRSPIELLTELNRLGAMHGIGRVDMVENRYVGMKSRGIYETPGGTILQSAHRAAESVTLTRSVLHRKDELMPRYAALIYNGYWWSPERRMLQAAIDSSQDSVSARVRLKLYKGSVFVVGREAKSGLYRKDLVTFEEDTLYDPQDAQGFITINALQLGSIPRKEKP